MPLPLSLRLLLAATLLLPTIALAEEVLCPCIADTSIASLPAEANDNGGQSPRIKLKVHQEFALMTFDLAPLEGRRIVSAELYLHPFPLETDFAPDRLTPLRWLRISTVSSPWTEGRGQGRPDREGHGATFAEASAGREPWAWPDSTAAYVIDGHSNSLYCVGELVPADRGYWKVPVDPALLRLLLAGGGYGLSVMDGSTNVRVNPYIASRESAGREPFLRVTVEGDDREPPAAPADVKAESAPRDVLADSGALAVSLTVPADAVAYAVTIDGKPLEPWQVDRPTKPGASQRLVILDLPADKEVELAIAAVDGAGNRSKPAVVKARTSPAASVPDLPAVPFRPQPGEPVAVGEHLRVWGFPEVDKVDPVTGRLLFPEPIDGFDRANPVWSGRDGLIRIAAARGEIAAFQLALQTDGQPARAQVEVADLHGPDGATIAGSRANLFRVWYVRSRAQRRSQSETPPTETWQAEYAIPARDAIDIPVADNAIEGQTLQAVYVDIPVARDAAPGEYNGRIRVRSGDAAGEVALRLVVYPAVIPDELTFNPELNAYGPPAPVGSDTLFGWYRVAHYNRCTLNILPYNQSGEVHDGMAPETRGEGDDLRVTDWTPYDKAFGPLLDGSAFAGLPRDGVPVDCLYLPIFENWPLPLGKHYKMGSILDEDVSNPVPEAQQEFPGQANRRMEARRDELQLRRERHDVQAPWIDQAFTEAYERGSASIVRQFVEHFRRKGWTRTEAQIYQNNKFTWGGTWWVLDEPYDYVDFAALAYFSRLYHEGFRDAAPARFVYRGDISRPEWMGSALDGLMEVIYFNSGSASERRLARQLIARMPTSLRVYGRCNDVDRSNFESAAWCLSSFVIGGEGVLPWQSIGKANSLETPNTLGLLVPGERFGTPAVASLRVLAMRHGAQQCELLRLLLDRQGWAPEHAALLIAQKVPLRSLYNARFADEAAARLYGRLSSANFLELKEGVLQLLAEPAPAQPVAGK